MKKINLIFLFLGLMLFISCSNQKKLVSSKEDTTTGFKNNVEKILYHLKNPSKDYVLTIAHRGAWRFAPENSYQAVKRCIELGIDIVEIDVRKTKDGHMVLMHDYTVDRTTNGTGAVGDHTFEEIRELRLKSNCGIQGSRQQVPSLEEIMLLAKDKILINLDKTEGKTLKEAYEILKKTSTLNQGIFKGNDSIQYMREKYGTLLDSIIYMPKVWYNTPSIPKYINDYNKGLNPMAYEIIFDHIESPAFTAIKSMNKKRISVLTIALWDDLVAGHTDELVLLKGPESAWGWLIDHGANAIMTDRPTELLEYLRSKNLHD